MLLKITFEVLVAEGGSRSSESNCERWRHMIVSPSNSGTPGMLKSNVLLVGCTVELVVRVRWCSVTMFGKNKFFHCVCAWAARLIRLPWSIVSMHDANVFRQFHRFPCSIWRAKFFVQTFIIDLLWTGRFSFLHKNTFCVLRFPRSITDWIGFGLGWFGKLNTWCFSKRLLNEFSNWLLFNCRTQLIPSGPIVIVSQWDLWLWSKRQV